MSYKTDLLYDTEPISDLRDMLNKSVAARGENTAFLTKEKGGDEYTRVSYNKFNNDINALGTRLLDMGMGGKHIAVIGENRYEWAVTYLAVVNGVGVIVPLDRELPDFEIKNLLIAGECEMIIYSRKKADTINAVKAELPGLKHYICMDGGFAELLSQGAELIKNGNTAYADVEIDRDAMCSLLFTSGTMGLAKGVMLSHKNLTANLFNMRKHILLDKNDIFLSVLPLHHTYECTCGFLCPLCGGSAIAYCEGLRHIQKNLVESRATIMLGVPLIFEGMYNKILAAAEKEGMLKKLKTAIKINYITKAVGVDLSSKFFASIYNSFGGCIRYLISGAAAMDPVVSKGLRDLGITLLQGYGLTECSPIVAVNKDRKFRDDSAGIPLPCFDIKIDNPNYEGIGEIAVRGDAVTVGYYKNEEATSQVMIGGWFHTGDLGRMDKDDFLYITGRKKNMILTSNGKNVYPEELESYLSKNDEILESFVYGKKNEKTGDIDICAEIVPDFEYYGETGDEGIKSDIEGIVKKLNAVMPVYKKINKVNIRREEFEKTSTRKIKRYKVNTN